MSESVPTTANPRTRTRGFLFADLRGYTAYVERRGDHAAAELLDAYRRLVRETVVATDGAEIRTEGDSFYVVFPSASAAVECGLAIVEAATRDWQPGSGPIPVGVGVHAGETAETAEGFVGSAVNIAARVCSVARPGELLVTDTVRGLTRTVLPVTFVPRGSPKLKGISEPIPLFRVEAAAHAGLSGGPRRPLARPASRTIAALVLGALAVVVIGVGAFAVINGAGASRSPSPAATPGAATPSVAPSSTPTPIGTSQPSGSSANSIYSKDETELLAQIPSAVRATCARATTADGASGGFVSLRCALPFGAEADVVWYDRFGGPGEVRSTYNGAIERQQLSKGTCGRTKTGVAGPYDFGITIRGDLLCYVKDGVAWLVWTHERDDIVAKASRADGDSKALYAWWLGVGPFLGPR